MALLATCWLIIESFIIPDSFLKWFYLSFYIHPFFLVFCYIFLLLKELIKWLHLLFFHVSIAFRLCFFIFESLKSAAVFLFTCTKTTTVEVYYDALGDYDLIVVPCSNRLNSMCNHSYESTEENDQDSCVKDSWLNEYLYSDRYYNGLLSNQNNSTMMDQPVVDIKSPELGSFQETEDSESCPSSSCDPQLLQNMLMISQEDPISPVSNFDFNDSLSTTEDSYTLLAANMHLDRESCCSNSAFTPSKQHNITSIKEDIDPFHQKYTSRTKFFNVLYQERLHGMSAIMDENLPTDSPTQFILWSRMAKQKILRSLECDVEMIYVAQSCLFWEALLHQYHKVEALTLSDNSQNILFYHIVSIKFQELQILLERFVEDQKCVCQGSSSNLQERLSFQGLLHVPDATGFISEEEENEDKRGEGIRATQVLDAINDCIKAFWLYIKTDNRKPSWKYETIWRTHPPVEDPQDLALLYNVTTTLHKKGILLKDAQGKSRCWVRRKVNAYDKRNLVFAMIDMKLVQRVLKMSLVSTSHLKWCQEKLNNLDFKQGKVSRACITRLFPYS